MTSSKENAKDKLLPLSLRAKRSNLMKQIASSLTLLAMTMVFFLVGCVSKKALVEEVKREYPPLVSPSPSFTPETSDDRPIRTASREKILDSIRLAHLNLKSLETKARIFFIDSTSPKIQNSQAHISYERPGRLFVRGYKELIPNFFTLAANEGQFWFEAPRYKTVYTGYLNSASSLSTFEIQLDPALLELSFLAAPLGPQESAELETVEEPYYLLSVFRNNGNLKMLQRKLWINRRNLQVEREIYYSPQGIPSTEFIRKNYTNDPYLAIPQIIEFQKLGGSKKVRLELRDMQINPEISSAKFDYKPPADYVLEPVS